jgi:hypothetical protein
VSNLIRCNRCKLTIESYKLPFGWLAEPIYEKAKNLKKKFMGFEHTCPKCVEELKNADE